MNIPVSEPGSKQGERPRQPPEGQPEGRPGLVDRVPGPVLVAAVAALSVAASFGIGMRAGEERARDRAVEDRLWIEQLPEGSVGEGSELPSGSGARGEVPAAPSTAPSAAGQEPSASRRAPAPQPAAVADAAGAFVASRSGTKYYLPSCAGAKRIKDENKVWFASRAAAEAAGYEAATNCPGL